MPMTGGELLIGPWQILLRLTVAAVIGTVLGLNREIHGKPAGMRTHALVSLGAALITLISLELVTVGRQVDSAAVLRTIQGLMAGIGFLGGGVILRDDSHQSVHGLTTAASVWVVASLGIACGAGQWLTALMALVLTLVVLVFLGRIEKRCIAWLTRGKIPEEPPRAGDPRPGLM
ncbi:MAG TPA: MgtC/SapB family protein [Thermoanaerobaculia bacterium]|nr:MgtC/SapB family protein [Thermoanaerobaculia bacterium]